MTTAIKLSESLKKTIALEQRALADGGMLINRNQTVNSIPYTLLRQNFSLALTASAIKESKIYSIIPNNSFGDFEYFQATVNGTIINEDGEIEILPIDTPRISWIDGSPYILIDENTINLNNDSLRANDWVGASTRIAITDFANGGYGNLPYQALVVTDTGAIGRSFTATKTTASYRLYIRNITDVARFRIIGVNGGSETFVTINSNYNVTASSGTYTLEPTNNNGWYELTLTCDTAVGEIVFYYLAVGGTMAVGEGYELCQVDAVEAPTIGSPIITAGSTKTRNNDIINNNNNIGNFITDQEGSLYIEFYLTHLEDINRYLYSFTNSGSEFSETFIRGASASSNPSKITFFQRDSINPDEALITPNEVQLGLNKMMVNWSTNEINISLNGQSATLANTYNTTKSGFKLGRTRINSLFLKDGIKDVLTKSEYTTSVNADILTAL